MDDIIRYMNTPPARTKEESADLIGRLDALTKASDTTQIINIQDYQAKHVRFMRKNYGRFMDQFEMFFCAMTGYSHNINYLDKKGWPINRGFQFVIATSSLKQFHSAYTLLCNGAYEDAVTILRSIYESFLRIILYHAIPNVLTMHIAAQAKLALSLTQRVWLRMN